MTAASAPRVELRGVHKRFGGVHAVEDVSLAVQAGEVVGLLGHNGAGKSTLMRTLSGADPLNSGRILIDGHPVRIRNPRDARALGIETLYQDLALAENLDSTANLFLGREKLTRWGTLDDAAMEREAQQLISRLNPAFPSLSAPVATLSGGERQCVAIARAICFDARVLIMDEPTASLGPAETAQVGRIIVELRSQGLGIFMVSHDLHDVFERADRICVMRGGRLAATRRVSETTRDEVLELIVAGEMR
jgi:D-xylose transport system ATP-binding protein